MPRIPTYRNSSPIVGGLYPGGTVYGLGTLGISSIIFDN
jgi:hypothetical protein